VTPYLDSAGILRLYSRPSMAKTQPLRATSGPRSGLLMSCDIVAVQLEFRACRMMIDLRQMRDDALRVDEGSNFTKGERGRLDVRKVL
jgi:hypothetical protein